MTDITKEWIALDLVDFTDIKLKHFSVDTRDFHVIASEELHKPIDTTTIDKYGDRFYFTSEELKETLLDLFNRSGGKAKWRMLSFKGVPDGWDFKYLRIKRYEKGLIICNNQHKAYRKDFFKTEINQEYLHAH